MKLRYDADRIMAGMALLISLKPTKADGTRHEGLLVEEMFHVVSRACKDEKLDSDDILHILNDMMGEGLLHLSAGKKLNKQGKKTWVYYPGPKKGRDFSDFDSAFDAL